MSEGVGVAGEFDGFDAWVDALRAHVVGVRPDRPRTNFHTSQLLNGAASHEARAHLPIELRRRIGAFFTNRQVANKILGTQRFTLSSVVLDPASGAGDLLLAVAARLPIQPTPQATLAAWGESLHGWDTQPSFVLAARLRLALLAADRTGSRIIASSDLDRAFPNVRVQDALDPTASYDGYTDIVLNPPYARMEAPSDYPWSQGRTSTAAAFLEKTTAAAGDGTRIAALLPDVLRSGSNYRAFRDGIGARAAIDEVSIVGRFDKWVDVDTFVLRLTIGKSASSTRERWWAESPGKRVADIFDLSVGAVVPHRDPESGPPAPYLTASVLPIGGSFQVEMAPVRRFDKRKLDPPFVVIRRTSAPGEVRARASVVTGSARALIENHLIVAVPKSGLLEDCQMLMEHLGTTQVTKDLDKRIRCRHLTLEAVGGLGWAQRG